MVAGESDRRRPAAERPRLGDFHQQRHVFEFAHYSFFRKVHLFFA
jgi:hypothetical protein